MPISPASTANSASKRRSPRVSACTMPGHGGAMATFGRSDDLQGAEFVRVNLRGAQFVQCDLSGMVMRGVSVSGADIDSPWVFDRGSSLRVNGVDVRPFVEAELNRRFP